MTERVRKPVVVLADQGRAYEMGRMRAVFKADEEETAGRYSISEWWLEPHTRGPGVHANDDDHIFYVIEGSLNLVVDGQWSELDKGGCTVIPGGVAHDFENRGAVRTGFICINTPAGFEAKMPGITEALSAEDLRIDR